MTKYYLLEYFYRSDENKDTRRTSIEEENDRKKPKIIAKEYLSNFFGDFGKNTFKWEDDDRELTYQNIWGDEVVEFISINEIPKSEYEILEKYGV